MSKVAFRSWAVATALTSIVACKRGDSDEVGSAPPPVPSAKPGVCASGGGVPGDAQSAPYFARTVADYCVDPNGDTRAYGEGAKGTLDDVCTEQLDGECEVYKRYGLRRAVTLRYVDGAGSPGSVAVLLSRFASKEGAYGFFTKRVVADGDPAAVTVTALDAGAAGALGSGVAYVFRGEHLAELAYTNETESPDLMRQSGKRILPLVAKAIGDKLPGDPSLPPAVLLLPAEHRLPMGTAFATTDAFGVAGTGPGAIGYYKDGEKRFRLVAMTRADEDAAGDVLETLKKRERAQTLKELVFPALALQAQGQTTGPRVEWVVGRSRTRVFGVGDEELVLGGTLSKDEEQKTKLSRDEKIALLKKLVAGP